MQIVRSSLFTTSFLRLRVTDNNLFITVASDLRYLIEKRHSAELPQVRFGLVQSRFPDLMGEVRSHMPEHPAFGRTIFALPKDESVCLFLLLGDKNARSAGAATGNDWYDEAIPLADSLWEEFNQNPKRLVIPS